MNELLYETYKNIKDVLNQYLLELEIKEDDSEEDSPEFDDLIKNMFNLIHYFEEKHPDLVHKYKLEIRG